jgi:hypothetical protein
VVKRLLVGRPLRIQQPAETLLPKWLALPVFSSDPISSVAYATEEIGLVLAGVPQAQVPQCRAHAAGDGWARGVDVPRDHRGLDVPLVVLDSPYREVARPVLEYLRGLHRAGPRYVITVFILEYVVGRWWEQLLHNQSALRLKARLPFEPGALVNPTAMVSECRTRCRRHRPRTGSTSKRWSGPSR